VAKFTVSFFIIQFDTNLLDRMCNFRIRLLKQYDLLLVCNKNIYSCVKLFYILLHTDHKANAETTLCNHRLHDCHLQSARELIS